MTHSRPIRSFVRREGRLTPGQQRAIERLWPRYGIDNDQSLLDLDKLFGRTAERAAEIGFGNGEALAELARRHPDTDFLGFEVHRPGIGRLLLAIEEHGLENIRIVDHDAAEVLESRLGDRSLDRAMIWFPDPWPKKRHHKRRLIQPPFLTLLARRLRAGGTLHLATDWAHYAEQMNEMLRASPYFELVNDAGEWARPQTKFERRGLKLGHDVSEFVARRNDQSINDA
ncbi:MAG: tRNA (guanosine(46)-N7)-methyltransferase TrmB [Gammaproteobacteria bacterium]